MTLLAEINRLKAELDALQPLAPEQEQRVLQKFRLEWNYNSNAIEGNALTLGETRSLLLHGLTAAGKPLRDHLDIQGHNAAVVWLEDVVRDQRPLTEQFIRGLHEVLLGEAHYIPAQTPTGQPTRKLISPGQYKTSPNNVVTATGEMFYFASPEDTPARMTGLVDWYRQQSVAPTLPPVALAAELHYRFVRIHPFDDGNGRMARLLMNLVLLRHGYPITVIQATDRNRYLAALADADAGDPEPFLRFIIENVEAGLHLMIRAAKGEAIDEPNDLDKKIALLKKQVLSREDAIKITWNLETQAQFYKALLSIWLDSFEQELARFNSLFIDSEIRVAFKKKADAGVKKKYGEDYQFSYGPLSEAHAFTQEALKGHHGLAHEVIMRIDWTGFRMAESSFNQGASLKFYFLKQKFEVKYAVYERDENEGGPVKEEIIFSSLYKTAYDHKLIKKINHQLANKVYDFIAAKVAEADAAPS